jgi:hypothetical protein
MPRLTDEEKQVSREYYNRFFEQVRRDHPTLFDDEDIEVLTAVLETVLSDEYQQSKDVAVA